MAVENRVINSEPWESLKSFTATTTTSEKIWRIIHAALFPVTACSLYVLATGKTTGLPKVVAYACYLPIIYSIRKIISTMIGYGVYPATFKYTLQQNDSLEQSAKEKLWNSFQFQPIALYKSGTKYDARLITHKDLDKRKWSIHALGNWMTMEEALCESEIVGENYKNGCNTLLINGPGVSRSKGWPTSYYMGAGYEAGLQLLEKEIKATHIVFRGLSIGNGMMSEAVLSHDFDISKFRYLGISERTFGNLSTLANVFVPIIGTFLLHLFGVNLRGIQAAKKLTQLGIEHVIIEHSGKSGTDGVIPDEVSLITELNDSGNSQNRLLLQSPSIRHSGFLPSDIQEQLDKKIQSFFRLPRL